MKNTTKWLEEHRSKDKTNWPIIFLEMNEEKFSLISQAALVLGMNMEEFCNYALESKLEEINEA